MQNGEIGDEHFADEDYYVTESSVSPSLNDVKPFPAPKPVKRAPSPNSLDSMFDPLPLVFDLVVEDEELDVKPFRAPLDKEPVFKAPLPVGSGKSGHVSKSNGFSASCATNRGEEEVGLTQQMEMLNESQVSSTSPLILVLLLYFTIFWF